MPWCSTYFKMYPQSIHTTSRWQFQVWYGSRISGPDSRYVILAPWSVCTQQCCHLMYWNWDPKSYKRVVLLLEWVTHFANICVLPPIWTFCRHVWWFLFDRKVKCVDFWTMENIINIFLLYFVHIYWIVCTIDDISNLKWRGQCKESQPRENLKRERICQTAISCCIFHPLRLDLHFLFEWR